MTNRERSGGVRSRAGSRGPVQRPAEASRAGSRGPVDTPADVQGGVHVQVAGGERTWLLTEDLVVAEATMAGWFTHELSWLFWVDGRGGRSKRRRSRPSLIGLHLPDKLEVAVFARPRKLLPSEMPDVSWLPPGMTPCVWWPGLAREVRAWLAAPVGDPPGAVSTTRDGAK